MARLQFTIRSMAIGIAVIGLLLAILIRDPGWFLLSPPVVAVVCMHFWFAKVPIQVRVSIEIALLVLKQA